MPYARLLYHAIWAMKDRDPIIDDAMSAAIREAIEQTSAKIDVTIFGVGIMPEHVHVFAHIPPAVSVASVIGRWKGASSHAANEVRSEVSGILAWQSGYGVLSVSHSGFDRVMDYVQNQRERHAAREVYGVMERSEDA